MAGMAGSQPSKTTLVSRIGPSGEVTIIVLEAVNHACFFFFFVFRCLD